MAEALCWGKYCLIVLTASKNTLRVQPIDRPLQWKLHQSPPLMANWENKLFMLWKTANKVHLFSDGAARQAQT